MRCLSGCNPIANEVIDQAEATNKEEETSNDSDDQPGREVTNAMVELLPSQFSFYTKAGAIGKNLDFDNAYKQIPVEPTTFHEVYDHLTLNNVKNGEKQLKRSFKICNAMESGSNSA